MDMICSPKKIFNLTAFNITAKFYKQKNRCKERRKDYAVRQRRKNVYSIILMMQRKKKPCKNLLLKNILYANRRAFLEALKD